MKNYFTDYFEESSQVLNELKLLEPQLLVIADELVKRINLGARIFWFGNGGSASDAQHLAAELVGRFEKNRKAIASISLNTDTSVITAVANDFGYSTIFVRQIQALVREGDVAIGITTSGKSENVILGLEAAQNIGALTICFTGMNTAVALKHSSHLVAVNTKRTCHIQEAHIAIGQAICGYIEHQITL